MNSATSSRIGSGTPIVRTYTTVLYTFAALMLFVALVLDPIVHASVIDTEIGARMENIWPMWLDQLVTGSMGFFSLAIAVLRTRGSPYAVRATRVLSQFLIVIPPVVGLLPFIYWFGWVRRRERPLR